MKTVDGSKASGRKKRTALWAGGAGAIVLALAAGFFVLGPKDKSKAEAPAKPEAQLITAVTVEERNFERTAPVSGEARPLEDAQVYAPVSGVRIVEVLSEIGDTVTAGQRLARLDDEVVAAQMREAEAAVRAAASEQARAAGDWARVKPVAEDAAFSREEVAKWRATSEAATAQLSARRAELEQLKARLQGGYVVAPVAGLIIERNARVGEFADKQALFRIVGGNRLEIRAEVAEGDILALKAGQAATFKTADTVVEATLRVAPVAVDPQTRTGEALFDVAEGAPIRAGMYLRGEIVVERSTALAVPVGAISYASGAPGVFVIEDGKAHLRAVELGVRDGDKVAVLSGLKRGEVVAASGGAFIMDGDTVRTTPGTLESGVVAASSEAKAGG